MTYQKRYNINDLVKFCSDENRVRQLLQDQGGYSPKLMQCCLGKIVRVKHIYSKTVKITYENHDFDIHPDLIEIIDDTPMNHEANTDQKNNGIKDNVNESENKFYDQVKALFKAINQGSDLEVCSTINSHILNSQDNNGRTPISAACAGGYLDIVETLLTFQPNLYIKDNDGNLPIHIAARLNHTEIVKVILKTDNDQINKLDEEGKSLLHIAVILNNATLTTYLVNMKIDTQIKDKFDKTAFQYQPLLKNVSNSEKPNVNHSMSFLKTISLSSSISLPKWKKVQISKPISSSGPSTGQKQFDTIEPISVGIFQLHLEKSMKMQSNTKSKEMSKNQCIICRDREMKVAFIPCGHMSCNECANMLFQCHLCKKDICDKMVVYI